MADYIRVELLRGEWFEFRERLSWKANKVLIAGRADGGDWGEAVEKAVIIDTRAWSFGPQVDAATAADLDARDMNAMIDHMIAAFGLDQMEETSEALAGDDPKKD